MGDSPSDLIGIDSYVIDDETVQEVHVFENTDDGFRVRTFDNDAKAPGVGTPEGWERIGACTTEWADDGDDWPHESIGAEVVYVSPDHDAWTTIPIASAAE